MPGREWDKGRACLATFPAFYLGTAGLDLAGLLSVLIRVYHIIVSVSPLFSRPLIQGPCAVQEVALTCGLVFPWRVFQRMGRPRLLAGVGGFSGAMGLWGWARL